MGKRPRGEKTGVENTGVEKTGGEKTGGKRPVGKDRGGKYRSRLIYYTFFRVNMIENISHIRSLHVFVFYNEANVFVVLMIFYYILIMCALS